MHFSIPETEEMFADPAQKTGQFTAFHLHVNGTYHCTFRYSQLHTFHEELKREFKVLVPDTFPQKKLLSLSGEQLEERRYGMETYFQKISQEPAIANSEMFINFLLNAQKEVQVYCEEVNLTVYLINGKAVGLDCLSTDQTDEVLEAVCEQIGLTSELTYYFGLYLVQEAPRGGVIIRCLQDFESPYISLQRFGEKKGQLQLRKHYWNREIDEKMYGDKTALNLLYTQAVHEIKHDFLTVPNESRAALSAAKSSGNKLEFLKVCRGMMGYSSMVWEGQLCNYPVKDSKNDIIISFGELRMKLPDGKIVKFFVQRMRCWKICGSLATGLDLGFHYLEAANQLVWINIKTPHAILISMCLQSVVDELIRGKQKKEIRKPGDKPRKPKPTPRPRPDGFVFTQGYGEKLSPADYFNEDIVPDSPYIAPPPQVVEAPVIEIRDTPYIPTPAQDNPKTGPLPAVSPPAGRPSESGTLTSKPADTKPTESASTKAKAATESKPAKASLFGAVMGKQASVEDNRPKFASGSTNVIFDPNATENEAVFGNIGDNDL